VTERDTTEAVARLRAVFGRPTSSRSEYDEVAFPRLAVVGGSRLERVERNPVDGLPPKRLRPFAAPEVTVTA